MNTSLKLRGTGLLLLAVFHAAYGFQLLNPGSAGIHLSDFAGVPEFTAIGASSIQYATNSASTILRIGSSYYLWRDGAWFRSSSPTGIYRKTGTLPAELQQVPTE